jgi:hypothetical protein
VVLAVNEMADNACDTAAPAVRVTLWATPTRILCDVSDSARGIPDPLAGWTPPDPSRLTEQGATFRGAVY